MRIITVTHVNTLPGTYHVVYKDDGEEKATIEYCKDAGDAAAKAMELAISYHQDRYLILGSKKVLDCIPENLRSGKH